MSIEHEVFSKDVGTWDAEIEVRPGRRRGARALEGRSP